MLSLPPAVPLAITPTFSPWTYTSDDSYIYQLSLVLATATVSYGLSSPSGGPRCCCDSCAKKGLPCCRRLRRLRRHRHYRRRCCFCCAAAAAAVLLLCCCCVAAVVTYGYLFSVYLKKTDAVLRVANQSFLFSFFDSRFVFFVI